MHTAIRKGKKSPKKRSLRPELTNHLGNVLAVVTDRKIAKDTTADATYTPQFFMPDVYAVQNYYAFGQSMPKWSTTATVNDPTRYRYGFNGKEDDDEWGKQDYGFRIYDPRVCRFLSVDPLTGAYPMLTPYQFASNTPIWAIDLDGLEMRISTTTNEYGKTTIKITLDVDIVDISPSCPAGYSRDCMKKMFRKEVLDEVSAWLSSYSNPNLELNEEYIFEFGDVNFFEKDEIEKSSRSFRIELTDITDEFTDYLGVTLGIVENKSETQENTIRLNIPAIIEDAGENSDNQRLTFTHVLAHELGHAMGLRHARNEDGSAADEDSDWTIEESRDNLMRGAGHVGYKLMEQQFKKMAETVNAQMKEKKSTDE